eukprot:SM000160S02540  [mRNA]  locus=s160:163956:166016:+ [translate_table: standard]
MTDKGLVLSVAALARLSSGKDVSSNSPLFELLEQLLRDLCGQHRAGRWPSAGPNLRNPSIALLDTPAHQPCLARP